MKKIRVIQINSARRAVKELEIDHTLENIQKLVGGNIERAYSISPTEDLFVNEEGMLGPMTFWFTFEGAHQPFVGNGVIIGCNRETGDSVSTKIKPSDLAKSGKIEFFTLQQIRNKILGASMIEKVRGSK